MDDKLGNPKIINEFKKRRTYQLIAVIPIIIAFILIGAAEEGATFFGIQSMVLTIIGFAIVFACLVFSLFNWRCPSCGKYLGKSINPSYCAKCGAKLTGVPME